MYYFLILNSYKKKTTFFLLFCVIILYTVNKHIVRLNTHFNIYFFKTCYPKQKLMREMLSSKMCYLI